jgi:hypothetical protein
MHGPGAGALVVTVALLASLGYACQPGMGTTPPVSPVPSLVLGLPVFLAPTPTVLKLEDPAGRPLTMTLVHDVRDVMEEAGFKLVASPEAASGVVATVIIQRVSLLGTDLFIHGSEACGVRIDITRGDALLGTAEPEVQCVSTSAYYGMLPKDAAVSMVNTVSHAPALIAVAEAIHPQPPPSNDAGGTSP